MATILYFNKIGGPITSAGQDDKPVAYSVSLGDSYGIYLSDIEHWFDNVTVDSANAVSGSVTCRLEGYATNGNHFFDTYLTLEQVIYFYTENGYIHYDRREPVYHFDDTDLSHEEHVILTTIDVLYFDVNVSRTDGFISPKNFQNITVDSVSFTRTLQEIEYIDNITITSSDVYKNRLTIPASIVKLQMYSYSGKTQNTALSNCSFNVTPVGLTNYSIATINNAGTGYGSDTVFSGSTSSAIEPISNTDITWYGSYYRIPPTLMPTIKEALSFTTATTSNSVLKIGLPAAVYEVVAIKDTYTYYTNSACTSSTHSVRPYLLAASFNAGGTPIRPSTTMASRAELWGLKTSKTHRILICLSDGDSKVSNIKGDRPSLSELSLYKYKISSLSVYINDELCATVTPLSTTGTTNGWTYSYGGNAVINPGVIMVFGDSSLWGSFVYLYRANGPLENYTNIRIEPTWDNTYRFGSDAFDIQCASPIINVIKDDSSQISYCAYFPVFRQGAYKNKIATIGEAAEKMFCLVHPTYQPGVTDNSGKTTTVYVQTLKDRLLSKLNTDFYSTNTTIRPNSSDAKIIKTAQQCEPRNNQAGSILVGSVSPDYRNVISALTTYYASLPNLYPSTYNSNCNYRSVTIDDLFTNKPQYSGLALSSNSVSTNGVTLTIDAERNIYTWQIQYSTSNTFSSYYAKTYYVYDESQAESGVYETEITGLTSKTRYYIRVYYTANSVNRFSNTISVTTK